MSSPTDNLAIAVSIGLTTMLKDGSLSLKEARDVLNELYQHIAQQKEPQTFNTVRST